MGILTSPLVVVVVPRSISGWELAEEVLLLVIVLVVIVILVVVAILLSIFGLVLLSVRRLMIRLCGVVANDLDITALFGGSGS